MGAAGAVLGPALTIGGGLMQAQAASAQGRADAAAARFNAQIATRNAKLAKQQAVEDERKFRVSFRQDQGSNVASVGASGIELSGSAMDVLQENVVNAELDALQIRHSGELKRISFLQDAALGRASADNSIRSGNLRSTGILLGTAAQALSFVPTGKVGGK